MRDLVAGIRLRRPRGRMAYAAGVLAVAMAIAVPGLVLAAPGNTEAGAVQTFTGVDLCKIIDSTNWNAASFGGDTKPQPSTNYTFDIRGETQDFSDQGGSSAGCGIPTTADAVMINILAVQPAGGGNMKAFASDVGAGDVSGTIINYNSLSPNVNLNNAVTVPLDASTSDGDLIIRPQGSATHIIGTVLGYYENASDDFYTKTVADDRFAPAYHDHDIVSDSVGSATTAGATEAVIASATISLEDRCSGIFFIDNHELRISATWEWGDDDDINSVIRLDLTQDSTGDTDTIDNSDMNLFGDAASTPSLAPGGVEVFIDAQGVDGGAEDDPIGSGDWTVEVIHDNNDSDSATINDINLIVESRGVTCDSLIFFPFNKGADEASETGQDDVDRATAGE